MISETFKYNLCVTYSNMQELLKDVRKKEEIQNLCNEYSLNMSLLHPLFNFMMKGFNNKEVAEKLGVHRVTIQRYTSNLKEMSEQDFKKIRNFIMGWKEND